MVKHACLHSRSDGKLRCTPAPLPTSAWIMLSDLGGGVLAHNREADPTYSIEPEVPSGLELVVFRVIKLPDNQLEQD